MSELVKKYKKDKLQINLFDRENNMGNAAANYVAEKLKSEIVQKGSANLILATGTSQFSFLDALKEKKIDWQKVSVFHLDEYIGISDQHPASFRKYLKERILDIVNPGEIYLINADVENIEDEILKYETLLRNNPIDIACIGIGENGHIAFNDPPVADFNDIRLVKKVQLDEDCRTQQYNEGWFSSLNKVPKEALTLTIPAIMQCKVISCVVPGNRKSHAVWQTLNEDINTSCPATILRTHPDATLFLDIESASEL